MSRKPYKIYYLLSKDTGMFVTSCEGQKELCEFLKREKSSVSNTLWKIKKGKLKYIKDYDGNYYKIEEDDEFFKRIDEN